MAAGIPILHWQNDMNGKEPNGLSIYGENNNDWTWKRESLR